MEAAGLGALSVALSDCIVEFTVSDWEFQMCIWLGSQVWLQIGFSESCAPFFKNCLVLGVFGPVSVTSELNRSCFIEILLVSFEVDTLPFFSGSSEIAFFFEASTSDFGE